MGCVASLRLRLASLYNPKSGFGINVAKQLKRIETRDPRVKHRHWVAPLTMRPHSSYMLSGWPRKYIYH